LRYLQRWLGSHSSAFFLPSLLAQSTDEFDSYQSGNYLSSARTLGIRVTRRFSINAGYQLRSRLVVNNNPSTSVWFDPDAQRSRRWVGRLLVIAGQCLDNSRCYEWAQVHIRRRVIPEQDLSKGRLIRMMRNFAHRFGCRLKVPSELQFYRQQNAPVRAC